MKKLSDWWAAFIIFGAPALLYAIGLPLDGPPQVFSLPWFAAIAYLVLVVWTVIRASNL